MKIHITLSAEENLWQIYRYHADYSHDYADAFHGKLTAFIFETLGQHPKIGTLYNPEKSLYRLIYEGRYNIYYVAQNNALYIVYILDGRLQLNMDIAEPEAPLPPLD
ncbi:MAG: hypothetical protein COA84_08905 [Robiginitomaculum sp.]|nr:MAG: hypothetical protein COA84_08905 [Robiginitomaculum sp.]